MALIAAFSLGPLRASRSTSPLLSVLLGAAVFVIWIGPDLLIPGYRNLWPFSNSIIGHAASTMTPMQKTDTLSLVFRVLVSVVAVPILEELFWRGWLMRWIINKDFERVPLGRLCAAGVLGRRAALCIRTRALLGCGSDHRRDLQLVDDSHQKLVGLHSGPRRHQRVARVVGDQSRAVAVLALAHDSTGECGQAVRAEGSVRKR